MGNTCKPMAVSFQCMTKFTTNEKKNKCLFVFHLSFRYAGFYFSYSCDFLFFLVKLLLFVVFLFVVKFLLFSMLILLNSSVCPFTMNLMCSIILNSLVVLFKGFKTTGSQ